MSIISALGRLEQKDYKFKASLGNIDRPCLKSSNSENWPTGYPNTLKLKVLDLFLTLVWEIVIFLNSHVLVPILKKCFHAESNSGEMAQELYNIIKDLYIANMQSNLKVKDKSTFQP